MKIKSMLAAVAVALTGGLLPDNAKADVIYSFAQVGEDVVATPSGSLVVTGDFYPGNVDTLGVDKWNFYFSQLPYNQWYGGFEFNIDGNGLKEVNPTYAIGPSFGFFSTFLYLPWNAELGQTYTPTTVFVWENKNLDDVVLSLTSTPRVVFTMGEQTISFVVVPEPATSAFLVGGAAFALMLRRRKA